MATLSAKQRTFVEEYVVDLNATAAARRAGYSARSASRLAVELLNKPHVRAEVERLAANRSERLGIQADDVVRDLRRVVTFDLSTVFHDDWSVKPLGEWPAEARQLVAGLKIRERLNGRGEVVGRIVELKLPDKLKALELLGRHLGMFTDRIEHRGEVRYIVETGVPQPGEPEE